jgi:hypothetical protein
VVLWFCSFNYGFGWVLVVFVVVIYVLKIVSLEKEYTYITLKVLLCHMTRDPTKQVHRKKNGGKVKKILFYVTSPRLYQLGLQL